MLSNIKKILLGTFVLTFIISVFGGLAVYNNKVLASDMTYGEITTTVESDTTLQYVAGKEATSNVSFEVKTSGMPDENDGTPVTNGYAVFIHPLYCAVTNNAIVFDTPISKEDMEKSGGLTIRMYSELSAGESFMVVGRPNDFAYGIYFYGLGATGGFEDHAVWVPADIKQNEYIDFKINAYDASRLADSEGMVRGLVLGSNINRNEAGAVTDEDFYLTNPDPYLYIKSVSLNAPDTSEAIYGEINTYSGIGGLTHVNGYAKDGDNGSYSKYYEGMSPVDIVPGYRSYEPINELPQDNGQAVEKAYRFTYHFSSVATVGKNSVLFERPLTVSEIEKSGGLKLRIYAHLTSDGSEYTRFNDTYGLFFYGYGEGITGESDDTGVLIPENVVQDEWTDLIIPAETLKLMAGDDGILYGLNYGSRIDVVSEAMYKGNTATNPGYVLLSKVTLLEKDGTLLNTKLVDDNTLKYIHGLSPELSNGSDSNSTSKIEWRTSGIPTENDNSAVPGAYWIYIHPFYAKVQSNAIAFETPISAEDVKKSGGLIIRMYAMLSASDLFYVQSRVSDYAYGIYLYGLGSTGGYEDHPVWIPADIVQNEWIDFKINAYDASRLADSEGMLRGITFGSNIKVNLLGSKPEDFYITDPDPSIYISSIKLAEPDKETAEYGELSTHTGMGNLTHVMGNARSMEAGETVYGEAYHDYQHSLLPIDIAPGPRTYHPLSELPKDNGETVEKAYRLSLHSGDTAVSKHSILFDKPIKVSQLKESGGLNLRIYAHLTEGGSPYLVYGENFGIYLYGYGEGITGETTDSSVMIPEDIIQGEWIDFYLTADQAVSLAGDDGVLYGIQYGMRIEAGNDSQLYIGSAYSNPGYILVSKISLLPKGYYSEKTVTYKIYDEVEKKVTFTTNTPLNDYFVYPEREGYIFCGWYVGSGDNESLFDFSSVATDDFTLVAHWVKIAENPESYEGLYTDTDCRIIVFDDGSIDISAVLGYYDDIGIGDDGVLYATTADRLYSFDLSQMEKSDFNTVSYYSLGKLVKKLAVGTSETVEQYTVTTEGFIFNGWKVGSVSGADFVTGAPLNRDLSLYASFTPIEVNEVKYKDSFGTYYSPISGDKILLGENHVAKCNFGGKEEQKEYYILENGRFAFKENGDYNVGNISPFVIEVSNEIFVKLTTFLVTFDAGDGMPYTVEVSGGDYKVEKPEDPTREGCVFVRWETIDGEEYNFDDTVYKSITLYGRWALDNTSSGSGEGNGDGGSGCSSTVNSGFIAMIASALAICAIMIFRGKKNA